MKDQIRRSAVSIPSNIAKGSAGELRTQLYLAKDLDYINEEIFNNLIIKSEEISKSLSGFIKYLQSTI